MTDKVAGQSRESSLGQWFDAVMNGRSDPGEGGAGRELVPVSGDASFRRYFRGWSSGVPYILVDAPVDRESCLPFVDIARFFAGLGINVPEVHAVDYDRGFMCLADFGDTLLWEKLEQARRAGDDARPGAGSLYRRAFGELLRIQSAAPGDISLPLYDEQLLLREMALFRDWFCVRLLGMDPAGEGMRGLDRVFDFLAAAALSQQRVCVHRDYHSRNLMYREDGSLGVLDFQDAVWGPVTYDLVSLLKDCYIAWPRSWINDWALEYAGLARAQNILAPMEPGAFLESFDLMGVQRHLKAIGIFARLHLRDGKPAYLRDIPRTLDYVRDVAGEREQLRAFAGWIEETLMPAMAGSIRPELREREQA